MARNTQLSNALVNAQAAEFNTLCSGGSLNLYSGTQPASANDAIGSATLLATLTFSTPAFNTVTNGVLSSPNFTGNGTGTSAAGSSGTQPTFYRLKTSAGATIADGSAGASGANATIGAIITGAIVICSGFTHTVSESASGL